MSDFEVGDEAYMIDIRITKGNITIHLLNNNLDFTPDYSIDPEQYRTISAKKQECLLVCARKLIEMIDHKHVSNALDAFSVVEEFLT